MNSLGTRVKGLRKELLLKQNDLSVITGMSQGNISEIEANKKTFSYDAVVSLARYLSDKQISLYWLLIGEGEMYRNADSINPLDMKLLSDFNRLGEKEKTLVIERIQAFLDLKAMPESQPKLKEPEKPVIAKIPISMSARELETETRINGIRVYDQRASAGLGNYLFDEPTYEMLGVDADTIPPKASIGIRICGDSMEPVIPDNSIVWVQEQVHLDSGQIGIFILNDEAFCKKLHKDYKRRVTHLVSLNPKYEPIQITKADMLRTVGLVVGKPYFF